MSVGVPDVVDPWVVLRLGVALLVVAVAAGLAIGMADRTRSPTAGVIVGTLAVALVYLAVTRAGVALATLSVPALAISAVTVAVATVTTAVRLSRAPL